MQELGNKNPYSLDWGKVTPDGYSRENNEVINVFNFDISSQDKIDRIVAFAIGKILWLDANIPRGTKQKIVFDFRGQPFALLDRAKKMKERISNLVCELGGEGICMAIEIVI